MMKIATIFNGLIVDLRDYETMPVFAPSFINIDVTSYSGEIEIGYLYDEENGNFIPNPNSPTEEVPPEEIPVPTPSPDPYQEMQSQILINTEMLLVYKELGI